MESFRNNQGRGSKRSKESPPDERQMHKMAKYRTRHSLSGKPRASSLSGYPVDAICKKCTRSCVTLLYDGLKVYDCSNCGMKEMKCNTLTCKNWHIIPEKGQRLTCKCQFTKFFCACDVFHSKQSTDISFECPNCKEHLDPPLDSTSEFSPPPVGQRSAEKQRKNKKHQNDGSNKY